jgi:hypothetical protein
LFRVRIVNKKVPDASKTTGIRLETAMDAKWNSVIDRFSVRVALLAAVFGVWLAVSYGVLAA